MKTELKKWMEEDGLKFLREIGVKKGHTVLDFGSGVGHYTIPASKAVGRRGKVYALDKDMSSFNQLKKLIQQGNIKNIEGISENSKVILKGDSADVVLCYDVIHYGNRKERIAIYNEVHNILKKEGLFSVYPKHHKEDYPLMELANVDLEKVIEEIEGAGFVLEHKSSKRLLHDENYNEGCILNFRKQALI
ncbi:MAG: class I SAM-dependent methyltransferase [Candidatus Ancaeobacter aquaticus]|nr:class I SAM-dependent methyltransferase [Candidatus Ancaeobacter aquaticus]